jgi:predicted DNA-binding transcriptional regulator YafY
VWHAGKIFADLIMLKTDRLFEIIHILRKARSPVTAVDLAQRLEVTPRTIYRYIAMLQSMRIPIEGAAGIGYIMRKGYDLPPLNFDREELEAIAIGLSLLSRTGDRHLQSAAKRVLTKIETGNLAENSLRVAEWGIATPEAIEMRGLRQAIRDEQKLQITYENEQREKTERVILPIALTYFVEVAILSAWCELRQGFRNFRVDRIATCRLLDAWFRGEGQDLRTRMDFIGIVETRIKPS